MPPPAECCVIARQVLLSTYSFRNTQDNGRNVNFNENRYDNGADPIANSAAGYTPGTGTAANVSSRSSSTSSGSHHHGLPNMQYHSPAAVGGNVAPSGSASVGIGRAGRAGRGRHDMSSSVPRRSTRSTRSVNYN